MHMALIFEKFSKVSSLSNMSTLVLTFFMELRKARPCDLGGALALFGTYYSKVTLDLLKITMIKETASTPFLNSQATHRTCEFHREHISISLTGAPPPLTPHPPPRTHAHTAFLKQTP